MPTWSNVPPSDESSHSMPLVRTPAGKPLTAVVTSTDLVGCDTHYWGGHTVPCEDPDCDACNHGIPKRWHGYVAAVNLDTRTHFIFEFTAHASLAFIGYRDQYETLRGCMFQARRATTSANSRLMIVTRPADLQKIALPAEPDVIRILATIWSLPQSALSQGPTRRDTKQVDVSSDACRLMRGITIPGANGNADRPD